MPGLTCGSTRLRQTRKREAPSTTLSHFDFPRHCVVEALHQPDAERQVNRRLHQDDPDQRIVETDHLQHDEDGDDQRHRREGMQHHDAKKEEAARLSTFSRDST